MLIDSELQIKWANFLNDTIPKIFQDAYIARIIYFQNNFIFIKEIEL